MRYMVAEARDRREQTTFKQAINASFTPMEQAGLGITWAGLVLIMRMPLEMESWALRTFPSGELFTDPGRAAREFAVLAMGT